MKGANRWSGEASATMIDEVSTDAYGRHVQLHEDNEKMTKKGDEKDDWIRTELKRKMCEVLSKKIRVNG